MLLRKSLAAFTAAVLLAGVGIPCMAAPTAKAAANTVTVSAAAAKTTAPTAASLVAGLKKDASVTDCTISHSGAKIAVTRRKGNTSTLSILTVATRKEAVVPMSGSEMRLYGPAWSFDDRYVSVHNGTAVMNLLYVADTSAMRRRLTVSVAGGIVWAPKSHSFAFTDVDTGVKQAVDTELPGATQLKIYNMDTLIWHRYVRANPKYNYSVKSWTSTGLAVDRYTLPGNAKTTLLFQLWK